MSLPIKKNKKNNEIMKALKKDKKLRKTFTVDLWNNILCGSCRKKHFLRLRYRNKAPSYDDFCEECKKKANEVLKK